MARELPVEERTSDREAMERATCAYAKALPGGKETLSYADFEAGYRAALAGREEPTHFEWPERYERGDEQTTACGQTLRAGMHTSYCKEVTCVACLQTMLAREVEELPGDTGEPDHIDRLAKVIEGAVPGATPQEAAELREAIRKEDQRAREELPGDGQPLSREERAELELLRDNQQRLIGFDGGAELMPWVDVHRVHHLEPDEPYIGCPFCRERFVVRDTEREHEPAKPFAVPAGREHPLWSRHASRHAYLCGECGEVSYADDWLAFKYDDEGENLIPAERDDSDPIIRCPVCRTDQLPGSVGRPVREPDAEERAS